MREIGKALALVTQIGVSMIVPIFLCLVLGSFLDKDKDTYIPIKGIENKNNNNDNDDESGDF